MTDLNAHKMHTLLMRLDKNVQYLKDSQSNSLEKLKNEKLIEHGIQHQFQIAIESAISIAEHIVARKGFGLPQNYAQNFDFLLENKIISSELSTKMKMLTRFRNRLVHLYWEVQIDELYQTLQNEVCFLEDYRSMIARFITKEEETSHANKN